MKRSRIAIATACVRFAAPSLRAAVWLCSSTVRFEIFKAWLICAADFPAALFPSRRKDTA